MADSITLPPPLPGTSGTTLPPDSSTIGGGATTTPAVTVPTTASPTTTAGGAGCDAGKPAPLTGGGSTTQVAGANGGAVAQAGTPVQGGGGLSGMAALSPVLTQLTDVIKSLTTVVGSQVAGASGGGATAAPAASAQPAAPAAAATPAPAAAAANAQTGAATVQGGGATAVDNTQLIAALQGVIQAITALVSVLQSQVAGASGGGAPGKNPTQTAPGKTPDQMPPTKAPEQVPTPPVTPPVTQVAGANGGAAPMKEAPHKDTTQVGGAHGGVIQQMPTQVPPTKVIVPPGTAVGGATGGPVEQAPQKIVDPAPIKFVPPLPPVAPPTQVGGANGGPVQQTPTQSPIQSPTQVGGVNGGGMAEGDVTLSNTDADFRATLTSKSGDSVSIWGDPHVTIKVDGKEDSFLIGYGPGSVQLSDGSIVSWDTNPVGSANEKVLKGFTVDSAGTNLDRTVTTGDKKDEKGLTTALNDAQLKEFATALRAYEGDWKLPLKLKDTPAQK